MEILLYAFHPFALLLLFEMNTIVVLKRLIKFKSQPRNRYGIVQKEQKP